MKSCRSIAVVVVAVFALAGCSREDFSLSKWGEKLGLREPEGPRSNAPAVQLGPAPAPIYAAGDTFVYSSDGVLVQEQVVSATPDRVTWTNDQGMIWTTSNDVVTPQLSWSSDPELGRGRQTVIGNPGALFPLQEGNTVAFGVRGNSEIVPTGWRDEHRCAVLGQKDIDVSAGRFTTYHISCQRKDHVEELYYSPVAQNYVLRTRDFGATQSRKELVSVALSDDRTKNLPVAVARPAPTKAHDEMPKSGDTMNAPMASSETMAMQRDEKPAGGMIQSGMAIPSSGNPEVDALVARLVMLVERMEKMSSGESEQGMMAKPDAKGAQMQDQDKMADKKPSGSGGKYGAHLASYRTVAGAQRGWRALTRKFSNELEGLEFGTTEFDAGDGKGTYIRLVAMSFASSAEAAKFCQTLKAKRQFCAATRARP
jgi:hypothetical protein